MDLIRLPDEFDRTLLIPFSRARVIPIPCITKSRFEEAVKHRIEAYARQQATEQKRTLDRVLCDYELIEIQDSSYAKHVMGIQLYLLPEKDKDRILKSLAQSPKQSFTRISKTIDSTSVYRT